MNDGKLLFTEYQSLYSSEKKKDESRLMQVNIFAGKERLCSSRPRQAAPPLYHCNHAQEEAVPIAGPGGQEGRQAALHEQSSQSQEQGHGPISDAAPGAQYIGRGGRL